LTILDEELDGLPERFRVPLAMCYLEGQTRDEAARNVGWSLRTFDRRLGQGRELLRARLERRGVTLAAALFATILGQQTVPAAVPSSLVEAAIKAGLCGAARSSVAALPVSIVALAEGIKTPIRWPLVGLVVVCAMATTLAGAVGFRSARDGVEPQPEPEMARLEQKVDSRKPNVDLSGDSLPEGAVLRRGTLERRAVGAKLAMSPNAVPGGESRVGSRVKQKSRPCSVAEKGQSGGCQPVAVLPTGSSQPSPCLTRF
jgi:hypothetical protein